jgi:hypothetical protein
VPQFPQPHLGPIEQPGEGQEFAGQHPYDDDVTGTRRGQEREARDDKGEPANEVEDQCVLPRFAPLAALAVVVIAGLEATARLDLFQELPTVPALLVFSITSVPQLARPRGYSVLR